MTLTFIHIAFTHRELIMNPKPAVLAKNHRRGSRNFNAKLHEYDVIQIIDATGTLRDIAKRFGIHESHVSRIRNARAWAWLSSRLVPPSPPEAQRANHHG
jgi:hypothetical protein